MKKVRRHWTQPPKKKPEGRIQQSKGSGTKRVQDKRDLRGRKKGGFWRGKRNL